MSDLGCAESICVSPEWLRFFLDESPRRRQARSERSRSGLAPPRAGAGPKPGQARGPYRGFRMASFIFLFAVVVGAAFAFYYVFVAGGLEEFRSRDIARPSATPAAHAP